MSPQEWERVREVFAAAMTVGAETRSEFVRGRCGHDPALIREVLAMLAAAERVGSFLEHPVQVTVAPPIPAWSAGQRIGAYELKEAVGAGGMGQVYVATDTRLDRQVAIKVLSGDITVDEDARDRLRREARAIAALNHPAICTLYDVGSYDGVDFLVMEYVAGETLAARLARGALPLRQALRCVAQIAAAVDAVHRAGLVHGDLKPGNVMLTASGVKVLDFGLATVATAGPQRSPLESAGATGLVRTATGTLPYMAPELVGGAPASRETDIFALGALLHEMVTGRRPFDGEDDEATLRAILRGDPPLVTGVGERLARLIRACLEHSPAQRWQSAGDLGRALEWMSLGEPAADAALLTAGRTPRWLVPAFMITAAVAALALAWTSAAPQATPVLVRVEVAVPPTSDPMSFGVSPDGRHLAYVSTERGTSMLWVRSLDDTEGRALPGTQHGAFPFWSPDGSAIGFFADGKLKRIIVDTGEVVSLGDAPNGRGGSWSGDGSIVFAPSTAGPLLQVPATGGPARPATTLTAGENSHRWPVFLPDGRRFLFLSTQGPGTTPGIHLATVGARSQPKLIVAADSSAGFAAPDRLYYVSQDSLVSVSLDLERETVRGEPSVIVQPVGVDPALSKAAFTTSWNGVVAYRPHVAEPRQLLWADRTGRILGQVGATDTSGMASPELGPDAREVALYRTTAGNADIWLTDVKTGISTRHTFDELPDLFPIWFQRGGVAFTSVQPDRRYSVIAQPVNGGDAGRAVLVDSQLSVPTSVSPDGRTLLVNVQVPSTGVDIRAVPLGGGANAFPLLATPFDEMGGQFSPDGAWIAYQSTASGRMEVYAASFSDPATRKQISLHGGSQPRWARDGRELYYVAPDGRMMAVPVKARSAGRLDADAPRPLFTTRLASGVNVTPAAGSRPQYDVAPDGRFLLNVSTGEFGPPISVIVPWRPAAP